ncbi:Tripartite ATP-independent periplasmic transporter, DctQ component [Thermosinus carboxydivorans Nor1]|uniref:Tripartite ATP-independent periplasmic transporter, DctQ component n=1 Tax=Thermosinus carboxydivorans Nor1 TaxID=401526 RepID=A1HM10_9FIRM|nr:TRAP transporter small permease [Thermosinus carboxydivorans]EAX48861.1 Tripartite ATP-independent periplasmic transporter, DctQ component [Thermosinus carboxydivorans Nor1]
MQLLRRIALALDTALETFALLALLSMILIVTMTVFTRKLFNFVFFWSEEVTLLLLVWFAFMGMAIGFREGLHLAMDTITGLFPKWFNKGLDKLIQLSTFAFGLYLIIQGWDFTVLMHDSTLAATKLPNSTLYAVMPVTGFMVCAYSALQFFGVDTKRHQGLEEGAE